MSFLQARVQGQSTSKPDQRNAYCNLPDVKRWVGERRPLKEDIALSSCMNDQDSARNRSKHRRLIVHGIKPGSALDYAALFSRSYEGRL